MKVNEYSTEKLREIATGEDHHPALPTKRDALTELERRARETPRPATLESGGLITNPKQDGS